MKYSEEIDIQTRIRVKLTVAAYAYEILGESIMTDAEFDKLARKVDLSVDTRRPDLDEFFRKEFSPSTGMWIHKHPDLEILPEILARYL